MTERPRTRGAAPVVVILAPDDDLHARSVARHLARLGVEPLVLDTAGYPARWELSFRAGGGAVGGSTLAVDGAVVDEERIAGVWYRRPAPPAPPPASPPEMPPEPDADRVHRFCRAEASAALEGWLHALAPRVVNALAAETAAARKPLQLRRAVEAGLHVPHTLVSNSPAEVAAFHAAHGGRVVFKVLTGTAWQITDTRRLEERHLAELHRLAAAPAIFQELVEGLDVRVTVVDDDLFPVEIRPRRPGARLDWRLDPAPDVRPHALPPRTAERLLALRRALGLRYAAMDLRRTADGEYAFFEVNPGGQFLFAEIFARQRISAALARVLAAAHRAPLGAPAATSRAPRARPLPTPTAAV